MTGIVITPAALHALLTDAHIALIEHRTEFAGTVLHVLCRVTDPAAAQPQGLARRLVQDGTAGAAAVQEQATMPTATAVAANCPDPANAGTPAPPTFHAPSLPAEEAQPAHQHHLPAGPAEAVPDGPNPPAADGAAGKARAPAALPPAQAAAGRQMHPASPRRRPGRQITAWTPQREARLREAFPTCVNSAQLLAELNAIPAPRSIVSVAAIGAQAKKLGIRRTPETLRQNMVSAARRGIKAANAARLATLAEAPRTPSPRLAGATALPGAERDRGPSQRLETPAMTHRQGMLVILSRRKPSRSGWKPRPMPHRHRTPPPTRWISAPPARRRM